MPRLCTVCALPMAVRAQVDEALLTHRVAYRAIARAHGLSHDALMRHERAHLGLSWQQSKELAAMLSAETLLSRLSDLDQKVEHVYAVADAAGDLRVALGAIREARTVVEAYARLGTLEDLEARVTLLERGEIGHDHPDAPSSALGALGAATVDTGGVG